MATKKVVPVDSPIAFTKKQLVNSMEFADYTDFLSGNLEEKTYTKEEVKKIIKKHYGKVGN